jgi:NAD(P)-dependent dehydrogenase (short-subunit alcohol dehydrogenase family)
MGKRLKDKNIVVTAAGQGIGRATAIAFNNEGANVHATDINDQTLETLNKEYPNIKVKNLDSTNKKAVEEFSTSLDQVDVLFNAVGFVHHGTILECDEKDWDFSFNVNIKSMYFMTKSILPKMIKKNKGSIINISSIASSLRGLPNRFVYGTTKAAIIGFTKSIASDFIKNNIRCNAIAPGTVHTPSWEGRVQSANDPVQAKKDFIARQPMGRLGTPEEIASLAIYLASDESEFVTGVTHAIDGGMSI